MAILQATLQASLTALLTADNPDPATVANGMASAYEAYAQPGQFLLGTLGPLSAKTPALATTLLAGMQTQTLVGYATAWSNGLTAFWLANPILGGLVGATIGCLGAPALITSMQAAFSTAAATREAGILRLVTELHTATMTVTGAGSTITVPPVVVPTTPII